MIKKNRTTIERNSLNTPKKITLRTKALAVTPTKRLSPRTKKQIPALFGGAIYLKSGQVSDLYRDIVDLHNYYHEKKDHFSQYFPSLIRMSMRLLTEAAASDVGEAMDTYLKQNFAKAKSGLDTNAKTTLSSQNVNESSIIQLLHIGAHNYKAANNLDQTIALSLILGKILEITHGR